MEIFCCLNVERPFLITSRGLVAADAPCDMAKSLTLGLEINRLNLYRHIFLHSAKFGCVAVLSGMIGHLPFDYRLSRENCVRRSSPGWPARQAARSISSAVSEDRGRTSAFWAWQNSSNAAGGKIEFDSENALVERILELDEAPEPGAEYAYVRLWLAERSHDYRQIEEQRTTRTPLSPFAALRFAINATETWNRLLPRIFIIAPSTLLGRGTVEKYFWRPFVIPGGYGFVPGRRLSAQVPSSGDDFARAPRVRRRGSRSPARRQCSIRRG